MFQVGDRVRRVRGDFKGMEAIVEDCSSNSVLLTPAPDFEEMGKQIGSTRGYDWHSTWVAHNWELVSPAQACPAYMELFI